MGWRHVRLFRLCLKLWMSKAVANFRENLIDFSGKIGLCDGHVLRHVQVIV